ncbi:MerR family transcriptional regulator [Rhodoplanes sp. Z2-YC6860]|uniref:MerR family transcriptional regulator n=1 Tax=Rhodoplanes sp. Z2-YC6860 TaxID=674703 RepID=UPI00078E3B4B|nr:helix-turn-helix domain-containing protein [Rhodoplanes sp. Z2-YC6860]AMN42941.1 transcriptional regulator, MerR family [Rhodoplanes sp. Z2-YC6860]
MDIPIGELSRRTGVKVPTIRYYEQVRLLPAPPRTAGHQRRYGPAEVTRLNFIRHARELGFEIEAVRELLALSSRPDQSCDRIDRLARRHMLEVERRIFQLEALRTELRRMLSACSRGRVCECRVIEALSAPAPSRAPARKRRKSPPDPAV